ncbi:uncharacterized protein TNCT_489751 [Trichonephila clavata]|uniref:Uncharacterized protein n=1 Tax=Trichonephila clavata TaxID=2740835 RepID=A0A8X6F697_TRICU|nr:uncharacterized protein TNCT_489751 [Trichonephila clavata]
MEGCIECKIIFAVLGVVSGATIFVSFAYYKNYNAAIWGLLTGILAALVLRLHVSYRRRVLHLRHTADSFQIVKVWGLILSITAITASIVYFVLAAVGHQGKKL